MPRERSRASNLETFSRSLKAGVSFMAFIRESYVQELSGGFILCQGDQLFEFTFQIGMIWKPRISVEGKGGQSRNGSYSVKGSYH